MAVATNRGGRWYLSVPELVGDTATIFARLAERRESSGAVFAGFDFPIGLPGSYGRLTGFPDFKTALKAMGTGDWQDWFDVCERADQISVHRPFYPKRPGGTKRAHLLDGLGHKSSSDLLRRCDRATENRGAACGLFWTLGGNQVGKGAISGWREVILPNLESASLWPFDGLVADLLASSDVVIAETYPGNVYHQLGIPRAPRWSKRKQADRARVGVRLTERIAAQGYQPSGDLSQFITDGFSVGPEGEDQFDAAVGLLGMLAVVDGHQPEMRHAVQDSIAMEGWILGQDA